MTKSFATGTLKINAKAPAIKGLSIRCREGLELVSSTEVRDRLMRGEDISSLVPAPVCEYIKEHA